MSKIKEFEKWAKQFIAIQDFHIREFLDFIGDINLHEMKCKFSEQYQEEISFSYSLQIERKGDKGASDRVTFYCVLQKKKIVRDLYIEKVDDTEKKLNFVEQEENGAGYGIGYRYKSSWAKGYGEVLVSGIGYGDSYSYHRGDGFGYGDVYGPAKGCGSGSDYEQLSISLYSAI